MAFSGASFPFQVDSCRILEGYQVDYVANISSSSRSHKTDLGGYGEDSGLRVRAQRGGSRLGVSDERNPSDCNSSHSDFALSNFNGK